MTRIAVLSCGGDTCALDPSEYGVVGAARRLGWEIYGIENGFEGLIGKTDDADDLTGVSIVDLTHVDIEGIQKTGGSILGCSRTNPDTPERIRKCIKVIERYGIDYIVPIGGDDTVRGSRALYQKGVNLNLVNKTMDNDLPHTFFCIGFPSTAYYATQWSAGLHSTLKTNHRDAVVYAFGRKTGWAPLSTGSWLPRDNPESYPHLVLVPEMGEITEDMIIERYKSAKEEFGWVQLVVSEGLKIKGIDDRVDELKKRYGSDITDEFNNLDLKMLDVPFHVAEILRDQAGLKTKKERESKIIFKRLDYEMRCGPSTRIDREVAMAAGRHAVELLKDNKTGYMVNVTEGDVFEGYGVGEVPLEEVTGIRTLEKDMFNPVTCTPTKSFIDYTRKFLEGMDLSSYRLFKGSLPKVDLPKSL